MNKQDSKVKLSELAQKASEEEDGRQFMDPVKKKRGRPPKPDSTLHSNEAPSLDPQISIDQQILQNKQLCKPLLQLISDTGVKYAGTKTAAIPDEQMVILVDSAAMCIHQYLPDFIGRHASLVLFSLTFGQWSLHVLMLRQLELEKLRQLKSVDVI